MPARGKTCRCLIPHQLRRAFSPCASTRKLRSSTAAMPGFAPIANVPPGIWKCLAVSVRRGAGKDISISASSSVGFSLRGFDFHSFGTARRLKPTPGLILQSKYTALVVGICGAKFRHTAAVHSGDAQRAAREAQMRSLEAAGAVSDGARTGNRVQLCNARVAVKREAVQPCKGGGAFEYLRAAGPSSTMRPA